MPYGRGGAGNIQAYTEQQTHPSAQQPNSANDLEANKQPAYEKLAGYVDPQSQQQQKEYAHSGRGGAGNWYSPRELSEQGTFHHSNAGNTATGARVEGSDAPTRAVGRGGAGNYYGYGAESETRAAARRQEEAAKRDRMYEDIERGVGETLAMPQRARLAGNEATAGE